MDGNVMMTMGQKSDEIMGRSTKRLRFSDIFSGIFVGYKSVFVGTLWPCFDMRSDRFCPHEPAERHILSWPTLRRWPTRATPTGIHRYMASGPSTFVQGLRDLSWVITESFVTREFSWPILKPGHVSPTSKDPSRCKPQRHLHPWGSDSMVSRRGGRSLQWKIDIGRYRVSNSNGASHHFVTFSLWKWPGAALEELKVKDGYSHLEQSKDTIDVAAQVGENILGWFWQNHSDVWQDICTKKNGVVALGSSWCMADVSEKYQEQVWLRFFQPKTVRYGLVWK